MSKYDTDRLILYLKGIIDWADHHPELTRDMLVHEMKRIKTQAAACLKIVEDGNRGTA